MFMGMELCCVTLNFGPMTLSINSPSVETRIKAMGKLACCCMLLLVSISIPLTLLTVKQLVNTGKHNLLFWLSRYVLRSLSATDSDKH